MKMKKDEAIQRLLAIVEICDRALTSGRPMLTYEYDLLRNIKNVAKGAKKHVEQISERKPQPLEHVIVSCDASITENPGGKVAVGAVIEYKEEEPIEIYRVVPKSNTNNQGEYDAIYVGITQLMTLKNNPMCEVEVRSDSQLVVGQLNGKLTCKDPVLKNKRDLILELIQALPVPVTFHWRPRNSTPALRQANYLAQTAIGVKPH